MDEIPTPPPTPPVLFIPPVPPRKDKIVRNSQLLVNSSGLTFRFSFRFLR